MDGVLAQLVERLVRNEKVRSSSLLGSTIFPLNLMGKPSCFKGNTGGLAGIRSNRDGELLGLGFYAPAQFEEAEHTLEHQLPILKGFLPILEIANTAGEHLEALTGTRQTRRGLSSHVCNPTITDKFDKQSIIIGTNRRRSDGLKPNGYEREIPPKEDYPAMRQSYWTDKRAHQDR